MQFTDQIGHSISLNEIPQRIISIVPSQTELLWDLGLKDQLVGITRFCIHPEEMFRTITRVGGTKTLDLKKIKALNPDLIIANKEENEASQIKALQKDFPVWTSDIFTLNDAFSMMLMLGKITGKTEKAEEIISKIKSDFEEIKVLTHKKSKTKVVYLIWKNPYMAAGKNTFIDHMLEIFGFENAVKDLRYPEINTDGIKKLNPDYIFLSSEPYPFREKHFEEFPMEKSKVKLVDGEIFSWYGSRLLHAKDYFIKHLSKADSDPL